MTHHSSRRSRAVWPAPDQPARRRRTAEARAGWSPRSRLRLLAGPAALLVVGAGLAATGISRGADGPAAQDVVAPAAARAAAGTGPGSTNRVANRANSGRPRPGATSTTASSMVAGGTAMVPGQPAGVVPASGQPAPGPAGAGTTALPGNTTTGGIPAAPILVPDPATPLAAAAAQLNADCALIVPANPLTAAGLATPYELVANDPAAGPCHEATKEQSAFVQAAIITREGRISLYNPLVIDQGTTPAAPPIVPTVPRGAVVAIWFGANGDTLTLKPAAPGRQRNNRSWIPYGRGNSLTQGRCVNGLKGSIFGQYSYCNAPQFFSAAHRAIAWGQLKVPRPVGVDADGKRIPGAKARDGLPCPTVRDFAVVDQDQSDNVNTHYLATADGRTAQPYALSRLPGAKDLANGSDNRLDTDFMKPALGCSTFMAPDQSNNGAMTAAQPLQELEAAAYQDAPVALVPLNDPMTLVDDAFSVRKTNLYRAGVDQPLIFGRYRKDGPAAGAALNKAADAANPAPAAVAAEVPAATTATADQAANLVAADGNIAATDATPVADIRQMNARARFRDNGSPLAYCQGIFQNPRGFARVYRDKALFAAFKSANAAESDSLFTFLAARAQASFDELKCGGLLGITNPIETTTDPKTGLVSDATFTLTGPLAGTAITTASTTSATTTGATTSTTTSATTSASAPVAAAAPIDAVAPIDVVPTSTTATQPSAPVTATAASGGAATG